MMMVTSGKCVASGKELKEMKELVTTVFVNADWYNNSFIKEHSEGRYCKEFNNKVYLFEDIRLAYKIQKGEVELIEK